MTRQLDKLLEEQAVTLKVYYSKYIMESNSIEPTSQSSNVNLIIICSVLIAALVAGGGVYAYQKNQNDLARTDYQNQIDSLSSQLKLARITPVATTPSPTIQTTATPTTQPSAAADRTADWKTYANIALGFSVKYPATLTASFTNSTGTLAIDDPSMAKPNDVTLISVTSTAKTLDQFISDLKSGALIANEQRFTFGGKSAYEAQDNGIITQYGIYTVTNGKSYILRFPSPKDGTLANLKSGLSATQNSIINSFAFTK